MEKVQFGKRAADGSIEQDTNICAVTGATIVPGDAFIPVEGTLYFYRVAAGAYRHLTADQQQEIAQQVPTAAPVSVRRGAKVEGE